MGKFIEEYGIGNLLGREREETIGNLVARILGGEE